MSNAHIHGPRLPTATEHFDTFPDNTPCPYVAWEPGYSERYERVQLTDAGDVWESSPSPADTVGL